MRLIAYILLFTISALTAQPMIASACNHVVAPSGKTKTESCSKKAKSCCAKKEKEACKKEKDDGCCCSKDACCSACVCCLIATVEKNPIHFAQQDKNDLRINSSNTGALAGHPGSLFQPPEIAS